MELAALVASLVAAHTVTVVAAVVTPKRAYMGCDSSASNGVESVSQAGSKVAICGDLILGYAGSIAPGQWLIRHAKENPGLSVRDLFDAAPRGLVQDENKFTLLAIDRGRIYEATGNGGIVRIRSASGFSYHAIGGGASVALGALYGWHDSGDALLHALRAAGKHNPEVRGPYRIVSL